ncbi:hypothetical protein BDK51DRAFT_27634, partial [Blyttiomyces helicus]
MATPTSPTTPVETLNNAKGAPTDKTVAFALDESAHSVSALEWTFDYILGAGDKLVVLTVTPESVEATSSRVKSLLRAVWETRNKDVTMSLKVVAGQAGKVGEILCAE